MLGFALQELGGNCKHTEHFYTSLEQNEEMNRIFLWTASFLTYPK